MSAHETPFCQLGKAVIHSELEAIQKLPNRINDSFTRACTLLLECKGRVIVTGMGKSGHVGRKIAATLASTGTPAFFVHPAEAVHGDLGMFTPQDVVIAISNSGTNTEILTILPMLKRFAIPLIALSGNPDSPLAKASDAFLDVSVEREACPHNLAPTSSTTVTLVMGDALAIALLEARGFTREDFARSHPGGRLGRRLLLHTKDIMHTGDAIPRTHENAQLSQALLEMSRKGFGMTAVINDAGEAIGIFTDGDLRRTLDKGLDVHNMIVGSVMTQKFVSAAPNMLAVEALNTMENHKIGALLIIDDQNKLVGVLNFHDLIRAGVA